MNSGLSNAKLVTLAQQAGITGEKSLACIRAGDTYADWIAGQTNYAGAKGVQGSDVKSVTGTPTVVVDGKRVDISKASDQQALQTLFKSAITAAAKAKKISL